MNKRAAKREARVSAALDFKSMAKLGLVSEEEMAAIRKKMVGGIVGAEAERRKRGALDLRSLDLIDAQSGPEALAGLLSEEELAAAREARRLQLEAEQRDPREGFARYRDQPAAGPPSSATVGAATRPPETPADVPPEERAQQPAVPGDDTKSVTPPAAPPADPLAPGSGAVVDAAAKLDDMLAACVISRAEFDEMKAFYAKKRAK
jgi:hypothetical protein